MSEDIGDILGKWPASGEQTVRKVVDASGAEKLQLRIDQGAFQGILQMELEGRPDGKRPRGFEYVFDYFRNVLREWTEIEDTDEGFALSHAECQEIFEESYRVYSRYVFLLQLEDYARVIRDTERNMEVFGFVSRYAKQKEDREHLERWWPYVLRIHAMARVMVSCSKKNFEKAQVLIAEVVGKIENLREVDAEEFRVEKRRALKALADLAGQIRKKQPLSESEELSKALETAVAQEEYEKAAELRDLLKDLEGKGSERNKRG